MKDHARRRFCKSSPTILLLSLLALTLISCPVGVMAKYDIRGGSTSTMSNEHRELSRRLSSQVRHELVSMAHGSTGLNAAALVPRAAKRIHKLLMEGSESGNEDGEVDPRARRLAVEALRSGAKSLILEAKTEREHSGRALLLLRGQNPTAGNYGNSRHLDLAGNLFYLFLIALVVMAVGNIVSNEDMPIFAGPQYKRGIKGSDFDQITPCNRIPISDSETFGYLPVLGGLFENDMGDVSEVVDWLLDFFALDETIRKDHGGANGECADAGETCSLTSECCGGDASQNVLVSCKAGEGQGQTCVQSTNGHPGPEFMWEPFCLLWSEDKASNSIDTLSFKPQKPWPPVQFVPGTPTILPLCKPTTENGVKLGCKGCDYHAGFPVGQFSIGPVPFKVTAKFDGIALSWARPGKLAFDPDYDVEIWDGFRNIALPQVEGVNFWMTLQFEVIPLPLWELGRTICRKDSSFVDNKKKTAVSVFKLELKMDLFVSMDATGNDDQGSEFASQIGKNIAGDNEESRNLSEMQRELGDSNPCVIVTATADINIPLLGTLKFGNIAGGYCTFPAEDNGNRCTPSGAFLNINQEFKIEGGALGILSSFLEGLSGDMDVEPQKAGNSLGVFMNDGDFEAVVLRLEAPVFSMFGVTIPGAGRPIIHFQYVKGSEIQRRRASILRTKKVGGAWIPNCANAASEEICDNNNDAHWADFGDQSDAERTQICKNILINPNGNDDKLMHYNKVIAAELKNPRKECDNYLIRPPEDSKYRAPERYDFSNDPDANVVILHLGIEDFGNVIIAVREISISLILSDGAEPSMNEDDKEVALAAYNVMNDAAKEVWQPPNGWHFPRLQDYLNHLPAESSDISEEEIEAANRWNSKIEEAKNNGLRAYARIFCKIAVLFFIEISLGLIMMNYADDVDPSKWRVAAQFETSLAGLLYSVSVSTVIDFDRRRHLHLEGHDYHRALANSGLQGAHWDVDLSVGCAPDSWCEVLVEFLEDVGEFIWDGLQSIGEFFTEDIVQFAQEAIAMVGEWGKAFLGAIEDFANGVKDLFLNGAVGDVLNSERVKAFNEDAMKAVQTWSDGKYTLDDIIAVGKLLEQGVQVGADFIVAGVTDIANAIGDFLENVGQAILDCFAGAKWDEARHSGWRNPSECEAQCNPEGSADDVKENCWCKDEFGCKVKVPQTRRCVKKELSWDFWEGSFWEGCETNCEGWGDMPTKVFKGGKWRFPRFEGRRFDEACREERMAKLAEVERKHGQMTATGRIVDSNFQSKFNGLSNFSQENRRRRRLEGSGSAASVNSVTFQDIRATSDGVLLENVAAQGRYDGSKLKPDSTELGQVQRDLAVRGLDFSRYGHPGNGNSRRLDSDDILLQIQRSAANVYLEDQEFDDKEFMARQPIIHPPQIELSNTTGTSSNPVELSCFGTLANAWSLKLNSAEPQVMRRRRTKAVDHIGTFETVIEFPAEATIRQMILDGNIPITITAGGSSDDEEDLFVDARFLLGTEGAGAFMDATALGNVDEKTLRHRQMSNIFDERVEHADPSQYEWEVDVVAAEPLCDKLRWTFFVTATDRTGMSNQIDLHAYILYGESMVNDAPQNIQTRCHTSSIGIKDLEYDHELLAMTGYDSFIPTLRTDNCPSPYVHLIQKEDVETSRGTPCTTEYRTVQRVWDLDVHTDDGHLSCPIPNSTTFPFIQNFTLGGLVDKNGLPATPEFDLRPITYYLPNKREAAVATVVSDLFADHVPPSSECGLCNNNIRDSVFYDHSDDFVCDDHGDNTVSVRVTNSIGVEVIKTTVVTVIDDKPPNVIDGFEQALEVLLEDGSVGGSVGAEAWDNCYSGTYELVGEPTMGELGLDLPDYEYHPDRNYFGYDNFSWVAKDWQHNPSDVAVVRFNVIPVNDPPYIYKSDRIVPFVILASDVDDVELHISVKTHAKEGDQEGLPVGLSLSSNNCDLVGKGNLVAPGVFPWDATAPNAFPSGSECSWVLSDSDRAEKGLYNISFTVADWGGGTAESETHSIRLEILVNDSPIPSKAAMAVPLYAIVITCVAFAVMLIMMFCLCKFVQRAKSDPVTTPDEVLESDGVRSLGKGEEDPVDSDNVGADATFGSDYIGDGSSNIITPVPMEKSRSDI